MEENKILTVDAVYNAKLNSLEIPVKDLPIGDYALRVFPEKSNQENLYKSTTLATLNKTETGFECNAAPGVVDCRYEIKEVKTKAIIVTGRINLAIEKGKNQSTSFENTFREAALNETLDNTKSKSKKGE